MKSQLALIGCSATLLVGIAIGSVFDPLPLQVTPALQADAVSYDQRERIYDELSDGSNALVEASRLLAQVARVATPSVVHIQSERKTRSGGTIEETGSGVVVSYPSAQGHYVVTNRHVVHGYERQEISIRLFDGRLIHPVRMWNDEGTDVAIMQIDADKLQPARWGDSDEVEIGHMVLAMGSPFGLSQSVTYGIISAKGRRSLQLGSRAAVLNQEFLQTDAAINPGNSGGPLIDLRGRVIGINTAIASNSGGNEGIGFSIPSNLVRQVTEQLLAHGKVNRAYLGVKLDPNFDVETARRLKLDRVRGARIVEVYSDTPAARAQLKFDDVVLEFGGIVVQDHDHLINLVSLTPVASDVELTVMRDGRRETVKVHLTDRPAFQATR